MVRKIFTGIFYILLSIFLLTGAIGSAIYNLDSDILSASAWSSDSNSYDDDWESSDDSGGSSWGSDSGNDSWSSDSGSDSSGGWDSGSDSGSWDSSDSGSDSGSWDSDW